MDERPPSAAELITQGLARLQAESIARFEKLSAEVLARHDAQQPRSRPGVPKRRAQPPSELVDGLKVADRLRAAVGLDMLAIDDIVSHTLHWWAILTLDLTPLPHDPACTEMEPSYEMPDGPRHDSAACRRRLPQHLSPVLQMLTLGEVLAIGVLIRCDEQPDYPLPDDARMVLESVPRLDLGRLAGLGAALAAAWTARQADSEAPVGTWLSRIRRCALRRPESSRPDPTWPAHRLVPTCGRFLLDRSQGWQKPETRRLACCPEHAVKLVRMQGARRRSEKLVKSSTRGQPRGARSRS